MMSATVRRNSSGHPDWYRGRLGYTPQHYPHSSYAVRSDEDMPDESKDEDEDKEFDMRKIPAVVRHATDRFNIT